MELAGGGKFEEGVERVVEGGKGHLEGVHDGWRKRKVIMQEVDLGLHGFGTVQAHAG